MPSSGHCPMIMDSGLTGADFRAHWQGADGGADAADGPMCLFVHVRACA